MSQGIAFAVGNVIHAAIESHGVQPGDWSKHQANSLTSKLFAQDFGNEHACLLITGYLLPWSLTLSAAIQSTTLQQHAEALPARLQSEVTSDNPFAFGLLLGFDVYGPACWRIGADVGGSASCCIERLDSVRVVGNYSDRAGKTCKYFIDTGMPIEEAMCETLAMICWSEEHAVAPVMYARLDKRGPADIAPCQSSVRGPKGQAPPVPYP